MNTYSLLLPLCSANHMGIAHFTPSDNIVPGDSNYDFDLDNQVVEPENSSEVYLDLQMDLNMCLVETIYKYDLSEAVKETKNIVDNQSWLETMKDLDPEGARAMMGEAMGPIANKLLNVSGE
jgi:hypothetical protein